MSEIRKAFEFIKGCSQYFMLTVNGDSPAGRPFTGIYEEGDKLYIATNDRNEAHTQMRDNENVQILAKKDSAFHWLRISGKVVETDDLGIKEKMIAADPFLQKSHKSADSEHFLVFQLIPSNIEFKECNEPRSLGASGTC